MTAEFNDLQLLILRLENEGLENAFRNNEITIKTYRIYQRYLKELERSIVHRFVSSLAFVIAIFLRAIRLLLNNILHTNITVKGKKIRKLIGDSRTEIRNLYFSNMRAVDRNEVHPRQHLVDRIPIGGFERFLDLRRDPAPVVVVDGHAEGARPPR